MAALSYWLARKRDREADWQKEKLAYYKVFIESMSGVMEGEDTPEGHLAFSQATNNLLLFAPQNVIEAVNNYRSEISIANENRTIEREQKLLAELLLAIRRDIGVEPADDPNSFNPVLWSSGVSKSAT